ncbi:aldose epimerase family protein [uncultured Cohaesibacter sp.]|uniref:aldose epimerase family protein n=1 Tax=uncultured Cohaesibacter sp. TaxID=1002546 RepID=UPI0029C66FB8|nr:aldose epimerase family protein [uncultured Cohaesibacter sp.]
MTEQSLEPEIVGEIDGQPVHAFRLAAGDTTLEVIDYGAILTRLTRPDRDGAIADIVLGYDNPADYVSNPGNAGAICGRHSNRLENATFEMDGVRYQLTPNTPPHHIHGGAPGFGKRFWQGSFGADGNSIHMKLFSEDGDQGYPGAMEIETIYRLNDNGDLTIEMTGTTDKPTIVNMVYHGYWNLAGHDSGDICEQLLQMEADHYTPVRPDKVPTGEILPVAGSAFDFTKAKPIGKDIANVWPGGGYDFNFCLRDSKEEIRPVARARDPESGRGFILSSNQPGIQFYTANHYRDFPMIGKGGVTYNVYAGFALETQVYPNGPNIEGFPSSRLDPGETHRHIMHFAFTNE